MADVHEIADGIFRIATFIPEANITFNQFLIADEKPLLFHTGQRLLFPLTLEAVRRVIVNVNDYAIRPAKVKGDGEVLDLGRHKLRFMITPQVPHCWDAILAFEE